MTRQDTRILPVFLSIILGIEAVLIFPYFSFAASNNWIVGGECDSRIDDGRDVDDMWVNGYCLPLDRIEHKIFDDVVLMEPVRYAISVNENSADAKEDFVTWRQETINDVHGSIGGGGWERIAPEDVAVGDAGFLQAAKNGYKRYVGSTSLIPDTDNASEGYFDEYLFRLHFLQGRCSVQSLEAITDNFVDARRTNHYEKYYRTPSDDVRYTLINSHPASDHDTRVQTRQMLIDAGNNLARRLAPVCGGATTKTTTPPAENASGPSPYAACAIKCLDDVDARYQCPLPSPSADYSGVSGIVLPDGSTRNFSPRDNECVDDRGKTQNACLFQCQATVGGEPVSDPMSEGQKIKVAGVAPDDPLNEAERYINLLRRKPVLPSKEEDIKRILGDYEAGKPMSVWDVKGGPEMQVPGSDEWVILKKGDAIPPGARIFTGMDDDLFVSLPGVYLVKVRSFTDITFNQTGIPKALSKGELINHLDLRTGDVEVHVERGTYQGTMQVRTPQYVAGVRGTHFWVSYDEAKRLGAVGVYEGEVAVDDLFRGTRTLLTPANDKTPRVIVIPSVDSVSVQSQDIGAATPRPQTQEGSGSGVRWLVFALVFGGGVFILHKTGKLQPIIRKVLALVRNDNSKPL